MEQVMVVPDPHLWQSHARPRLSAAKKAAT